MMAPDHVNREVDAQGEERPPTPAGASAPSDVGGRGLQPQPNSEVERVVDKMAAYWERLRDKELRRFRHWLARGRWSRWR